MLRDMKFGPTILHRNPIGSEWYGTMQCPQGRGAGCSVCWKNLNFLFQIETGVVLIKFFPGGTAENSNCHPETPRILSSHLRQVGPTRKMSEELSRPHSCAHHKPLRILDGYCVSICTVQSSPHIVKLSPVSSFETQLVMMQLCL